MGRCRRDLTLVWQANCFPAFGILFDYICSTAKSAADYLTFIRQSE
jgi:hypothetical protein